MFAVQTTRTRLTGATLPALRTWAPGCVTGTVAPVPEGGTGVCWG